MRCVGERSRMDNCGHGALCNIPTHSRRFWLWRRSCYSRPHLGQDHDPPTLILTTIELHRVQFMISVQAGELTITTPHLLHWLDKHAQLRNLSTSHRSIIPSNHNIVQSHHTITSSNNIVKLLHFTVAPSNHIVT